jgi:hypothetical protein
MTGSILRVSRANRQVNHDDADASRTPLRDVVRRRGSLPAVDIEDELAQKAVSANFSRGGR